MKNLQRLYTAPEASRSEQFSPVHSDEPDQIAAPPPQLEPAVAPPPALEGLRKRESVGKRLMRLGTSLGSSLGKASVDKGSPSKHKKSQRRLGESIATATAREARLRAALDRQAGCVEKLKAELYAGLDSFPFAEPSAEQDAMESDYIQWAEARIQERVDMFGTEAGYHVVGDMRAVGHDAALPLAYDFVKGLIIGAMRGPFGNMVALPYQNTLSPSSEPMSMAALAGTIGGLGSFACDTMVLPALDRRARVANMPILRKVDPKVLVPDPPPVLLQITPDGRKRFLHPGDPGVPSRQELAAKVFDDRSELIWRQDALTDNSPDTLMLRPTVSGAFSGARRSLANHAVYPMPVEILLGFLTGSLSGAFHKGILHAGKVSPRTGQVRVHDLLGGHQRLNLFAMALPDQTRPPATWSDAVHIPRYLSQSAKEGMALARQVFSTGNAFRTALRDMMGRHMAGSIMSNLAALGATRLIVSPLRHGQSAPLPGEPDNSPIAVLQQAMNSFFSDVVWVSFKAKVGPNTSQSKRLDHEEAIAFNTQDSAILRSLWELKQPVDSMIEMLSPIMASDVRSMEEGEITQVPFSSSIHALRTALEELREEMRTRTVAMETVKHVLECLTQPSTDEGGALPDSRLFVSLTQQLAELWKTLVKNEELIEWHEGVT